MSVSAETQTKHELETPNKHIYLNAKQNIEEKKKKTTISS